MLVDDLSIEFCRVCCKQEDVHARNGSRYIYTRAGRFDPHDLNDLMPLVEDWCRKNNCSIAINYIVGAGPIWRVTVAINKHPFNISYQSSSLPEAVMGACIDAQKIMEAAA